MHSAGLESATFVSQFMKSSAFPQRNLAEKSKLNARTHGINTEKQGTDSFRAAVAFPRFRMIQRKSCVAQNQLRSRAERLNLLSALRAPYSVDSCSASDQYRSCSLVHGQFPRRLKRSAGRSLAYVAVIELIITLTAQVFRPLCGAGVATVRRRHPECHGATPFDTFNDTCIDV